MQVRAIESEAACRARREVLDEHIGLAQQAFEHPGGVRMLEIESEALLGAVQPDEMRGLPQHGLIVMPGKVPGAWSFDLDDACTQISQLARGKGSCYGLLQRNNRHAMQRQARRVHTPKVRLFFVRRRLRLGRFFQALTRLVCHVNNGARQFVVTEIG